MLDLDELVDAAKYLLVVHPPTLTACLVTSGESVTRNPVPGTDRNPERERGWQAEGGRQASHGGDAADQHRPGEQSGISSAHYPSDGAAWPVRPDSARQ